ncbi:WLM-domain-containing protein [Microthyrium microscopicum]|uniref:WLM-domain-containing protein n=1 Tax=Microthyrium microscopicum TaxID=703497 RepID=A0A6A6TZX1_9PEZI|nr:WLM-domain-containing protein [Microthyrium microscopicum]
MPLGFERINERVKRPNELINFIRPLKGPAEATSQDFLERIAAIVYPVMRDSHIAVMALEEYPPNTEFWGRNFNAGEVIQLVLKRRDGGWLPFRHVQMVMIHELAHCKEMNHSRFFWRVRNEYASGLTTLWAKGYTGEGFWGSGRGLGDGTFLHNNMPDESISPDSLCGGAYKNRGKRKRGGKSKKPELSSAERKQRRILKKFGAGGTALGGDEQERQKLENGKKVKGKPRVAGSARARELRAAAALARFSKVEPSPEPDSSETEWDESETEDETHILKSNGKELVRVCGDMDENDADVKREKDEMMATPPKDVPTLKPSKDDIGTKHSTKVKSAPADHNTVHRAKVDPPIKKEGVSRSELSENALLPTKDPPLPRKPSSTRTATCEVCSLSNDPGSTICMACSNVLDPSIVWNHWKCTSDTCKGGAYINPGDYGLCQLCGARKP